METRELNINDSIEFDSLNDFGKIKGVILNKFYIAANDDKEHLMYEILPEFKFWNYGESDTCFRTHNEVFGNKIYKDAKI